MKLLKLLFFIGLLSKTIDASKRENVSVAKISQRSQSGNRSWKEDVQAFHTGVLKANEKLRGTALDRSNAINYLQDLIAKLTDFTNCESETLATSSTDILISLSRCSEVGGSGPKIISEFEKVLLLIVKDFNKIAKNLTVQIGKESIGTYTEAVSDLGCAFSNYMKEILESRRPFGSKKEIDYKPTHQKLQNLMNVVATIGESLCNSEVTEEVQAAVLVLNLIYIYLANAVQAISACAMEVMQEQSCQVSQSFKSCSLSLDGALSKIIRAVKDVVFPLTESVKFLVTVVSSVAETLNAVLSSVVGLVDGVGKITSNLLKA